MKNLIAKIKQLRIVKAFQRYSKSNGNLLAGGVTYSAFWSVIPAIALGFTIFGIVLRGNPDMLNTIAESVDNTLPGLVQTDANPDAPIRLSTPQPATLTITGIVSLLVLLNSGIGWISALRTAIRTLFGLDASADNAVMTKVRDLGALAILGVGIALSGVLSSAVGAAATSLAAAMGLDNLQWLVTVVGLFFGFLFDVLLMVVLLRMLTGVKLPFENLRDGAAFGALLLTVVKYFGSMLIARGTSNPLFATLGAAVALLFWLYLMSRIVLLAAAWAANDVDIAMAEKGLAQGEQAETARAQLAAVAAVAAAGHGAASGVSAGGRAARVGAQPRAMAAAAKAGPSGRSARFGPADEDEAGGGFTADELIKAAGGVLGAAALLAILRNREG